MTETADSPQKTVRVVSAPLAPPSAHMGLLSVFQRRYLLRLLVRREVSARYSGSFLGLIWSYINPLSQFCIYFFIMGVVFALHKGISNFAIHIFAAIVVVHFFTETFNGGTQSLIQNRQLITKLPVPREMFPVSRMLVAGWHTVPMILILVFQ